MCLSDQWRTEVVPSDQLNATLEMTSFSFMLLCVLNPSANVERKVIVQGS